MSKMSKIIELKSNRFRYLEQFREKITLLSNKKANENEVILISN